MRVKIRRVDKMVPLPEYHSDGPSGFDLYTRAETTIEPRSLGLVPLNVSIRPPEGHILILAARSSTPKRGLMLANGIGVGDYSFSGNDDEYRASVYNFTDSPVVVPKGDRIVQGFFLPVDRVEWEEVGDMGLPNRGGFGSTGK